MEYILFEAQKLNILKPLDVQFAHMISSNHQPALMLACACLSAHFRNNHVCLPLYLLTPKRLFKGKMISLAYKAWLKAGSLSISQWKDKLLESKIVSNGTYIAPLVLDQQRLYLYRMWKYECVVSKFFNKLKNYSLKNINSTFLVLNDYFYNIDSIKSNLHKIIALTVIKNKITLISGISGTGKTSIIAKLTMMLIDFYKDDNIKIIITAPTVKTAENLNIVFNKELNNLKLNTKQKKQLPLEVITLYNFFKKLKSKKVNSHYIKKKKYIDILIIDEASIIDLQTMASIVSILELKTRIVLLGDHYRISSLESKTLFNDLYVFYKTTYNKIINMQFLKLTSNTFPMSVVDSNNIFINNNVCLLKKNYRLKKSSNIKLLIHLVNSGNYKKSIELLKSNNTKKTDIFYKSIEKINTEDYIYMLNNCVKNYKKYLYLVNNNENPLNILIAFNSFRLLSVIQEGHFGAFYLNYRIELLLKKQGLIKIHNNSNINYYSGKPIIISCNAEYLELYVGDIGIILLDEKKEFRVYFLRPHNVIKNILLSRLPKHKLAFVITVDKSQGLNFIHAALVLPNTICPELTRELIYSAIICASQKFSIYSTEYIIQYSIKSQTKRYSALINRLST